MAGGEAFSRVKIDAQLTDVGWNLSDGRSVHFEYTLDDGTRADYVLADRHGRSMAVVEAKKGSINPVEAEGQALGYATAMPRHVLRRLAVALLGVALLAASPNGSRADDAGAAAAFLVSLTDQAIEQLTDASLPIMERERSFRSLFRAKFDIPAIGRFVLGRYWRKARPELRKEFLSAFEEIIAQSFTSRFAGYADTKFEVVSVQALKRAGQFKVSSRIAPTKDEVYLVGWLVENKNGQFRVLDVIAEGVSMALTLRSEYASVIKRSGGRVEGLVAQMHEHIE